MASIEVLNLSPRSENCLYRGGIMTIEELQQLTDDDFLHIRMLGKKSIKEIKEKLAEWENAQADISERAYHEIVAALKPVLTRERMLKAELKEIQRKKLELALIIAGVDDNELVKQLVSNIVGFEV